MITKKHEKLVREESQIQLLGCSSAIPFLKFTSDTFQI